MKKGILLLTCMLLFATCGCTKEQKEHITGKSAKAFLEEGNTVLVDVRTDVEYDKDHIEGAISIPVDTPKIMIERILKEKQKRIIVYCQSGNRSQTFKEQLTDMGYTNVYDLGAKENWNH